MPKAVAPLTVNVRHVKADSDHKLRVVQKCGYIQLRGFSSPEQVRTPFKFIQYPNERTSDY